MNLINEDRLKIWRALSDLFLDTEITDGTYLHIAKIIQETEFSASEVETILWHEVYPVLEGNLRSVAGEWVGWPDDWLMEHLSVCNNPSAIMGEPTIINEIKECWSKVMAILPRKNA